MRRDFSLPGFPLLAQLQRGVFSPAGPAAATSLHPPRQPGTGCQLPPGQLWAAIPFATAVRLCSLASFGVCENHRVYRSSLCHRVAESCTAPRNQSGLGKAPGTPTTQPLPPAFRGGVGQRWSPVGGASPYGQLPGCCLSPGNPGPLLHSSGRTYSKEGYRQEAPAPHFGFTIDQG